MIATFPYSSDRYRMPDQNGRPSCTACFLFAFVLLLAMRASDSLAEEVWLHDNTRVYGLIRGVTSQGELQVLQATGDEARLPLENVIAIRFLGRTPLLIQSGAQEFRLQGGSRLRGQILQNEGDLLQLETAVAGAMAVNFSRLRGFVSLPLAGFSGRKAEELVDTPDGRYSPALDIVLDRRGSTYPGVVRRLTRTDLDLDHEELLQVVPVKILYVAGVRLADAARDPLPPWQGEVRVRITGRDESIVEGVLQQIRLGRWSVRPVWSPEEELQIDVEEIALVQVLGGRVQYLSQLEPTAAEESTVLAPPQPYRMDAAAQGGAITIAGKRYPWGIGVHADSSLEFELGGRFQEFRADVGLAGDGEQGSVIFKVFGDDRELYSSGVVKSPQAAPMSVQVSVAGVKKIRLEVTSAGDLDLGDAANWGSARVVR
ncbi:NPCBM/NEW2 domain-containing protein [Lignipirellula cremea]|uniref:NPCBM/NEW2 domain protein n=1 Tax=Lignipirellula cremea TaxID=2528010 RepID=A0A518DWC7_9BACT|nr:NPCBM/NEW2 domain-containing protein [Lignipirellula cremea]QDU96141.1 NPCBM/NEW2 domain protein [Lignipirellula cremea]